jgi:hypothetical protein
MIPVIHDATPPAGYAPPPGHATGLIPRNYRAYPPGYQPCSEVFPSSLFIPEGEQAARLSEQQAQKASLFDLRSSNYDALKSLDQDGYGYCWAFSTTKSVMYLRAAMGEPALRLSAWMVASIIKNYQDEGGWGAESLQFWAEKGGATLDEWPQGKVDPRYDTPAMRTAALARRVTEWWDGTDDRSTNVQIMISAFLMGFAPVLDFNWWGHSVCGCRLVSISPLVVDIDNSWGESAGDKGIYRLEGNKAIPDGIVVPRVASPTQV